MDQLHPHLELIQLYNQRPVQEKDPLELEKLFEALDMAGENSQ